jgi:DNA-binding IclR family transcriptional regulator
MSATLARALEVLDVLAARPRSLPELTELFEAHRTTLLRQLRTLEHAGIVVARDDGSFAIGPRIISIATRALDTFELRPLAHARLRELQATAGHTVHLAQLVDGRILYIDKVDDDSGVRLHSRVGRSVIPHAAGVGKAVLSLLDTTQRDRVLADTQWTAYTSRTITSRVELDAELERVRERGYALDDGEFEDFVTCIAVPFRNGSQTLVGAISITALRPQKDLDYMKSLLPELQAAVDDITRQLT